MKISYNWLSRYIDIPFSTDELVEKLTMLGVEVEAVENINQISDGIVAAEILERKAHPNADKLSVCIVDSGKEKLQIVCGASNCDAGKKVPLAQIGTLLVDHEKKTELTIKQAKLRGVDSFGMLCSRSELSIAGDSAGLLELPQDCKAGASLKEYYKPDTIYDLEITSNRPDWNSFIGIAREIQAVSDNKIRYPETAISKYSKGTDVSVSIEDFDSCPKYTARVVRNVKVAESPHWLKEAIQSIGLRPINNIVDITNFVLFETGQPLHAFDLNKLQGGKIIVRRANCGEKIKALDAKEYELNSEYLVIADASKPVAIAGVMGGEESGVGFETKNILIESAYFNSLRVKKATRDLAINSDSSYRFERGVDSSALENASNRAALLIQEIAGGEIDSELITVVDNSMLPIAKKVLCRFDNLRALLGVDISNEKIISIFRKLEIYVENITNISCEVQSKTFRLDIEREADLAEEVIRIYGLSNIPERKVYAQAASSFKKDSYYNIETARNQLVALGLTECVNYTLIDKKQILKDDLFEEKELLEVINPISAESSAMRPSLLFGVLKAVNRNVAHNIHDLALFETGKVYSKKYQKEEMYSCCIALTGRIHPEMYSDEKKRSYDFFDMKGLLESWFGQRSLKEYSLQESKSPLFKEGISANIILKNETIASFGEVSDSVTKGMRLRSPLYVAIVNLEKLVEYEECREVSKYSPVPVYPSVSRDIALVCDESLGNAKIVDCMNSSGCSILESIDLFDLYRDKTLGEGKKSFAYSLTYRSTERTLTDSEVNKAHEEIRAILVSKLSIELR